MSRCTHCGFVHSPAEPVEVVHHLQRAVDIQCRRAREWPALIEALPEAAREPVRRWLAREHERPGDGRSRHRRR